MDHLWTPKHPYYCTESQPTKWRGWAAFAAEMGESDVDLNLVFRWDILCDGDDDEGNHAPDWTAATLVLNILHQRKGYYRTHEIRITRDDEPRIVVYLTKHWQTVQAIWAPFTADAGPAADEMRRQLQARRIAALEAELAELRGTDV